MPVRILHWYVWRLIFNIQGDDKKMNSELFEALEVLEKEKNISKDTLLEAIEQSLIQACKNHFWQSGQCTCDH